MLPENHSVPESTSESQKEANPPTEPSLKELADLYRVPSVDREVDTHSASRSKRITELKALVKGNEGTENILDSNDLSRDELASSSILLRSMVETDILYEKAKTNFGRELTSEEEEVLRTTLDYVLRRIITQEIRKTGEVDLRENYDDYFKAVQAGDLQVLPGGRDMFVGHDLSHVLLSLKLGSLNENSPIPTFMQDEVDFNSGEQAMLEEAFATTFTPGILDVENDYDAVLKNEDLIYEEAFTFFNEKTTPLFRGMTHGEEPYFTDPVLAEDVMSMLRAFIYDNEEKLKESTLIVSIALFSQGAAFVESLNSTTFQSLSEKDRLDFIKNHIQMAQKNIDALISGEVPKDSGLKYKNTVDITRDTVAKSLAAIKENPEKPVFVEMLLESLHPMYQKAQAQAQSAYERLI